MAEITLTKDNFDKEVLQADKPVLVDFWAPWCGPCRMLAPTLEQVAKDVEGKAVVGKCNIDEQPELASQYGIMTIPSLLVFEKGKIVEQTVGVQPKGRILAMLNR